MRSLAICIILLCTPSHAQTISEQVAKGGSVTLAPGKYDEPLVIDKDGVHVSAYNVTLTKPVLIRSQRVRLEGLTIENADVGVQILRGQGLSLRDLHCTGCGIGFLFSARDAGRNSQVTYSMFQNCIARDCKVGFEFDSSAEVGRSWCNANTFVNCCARKCDVGWLTSGKEPNFSYNTFIGGSSEQCLKLIDMPHANDVLFVGCHMVANERTEQAILGRHCKILGGRWMCKIAETVEYWTGGHAENTVKEIQKKADRKASQP